MLNARQGPHLCQWIERISKSNGFTQGDETFQELRRDPLVEHEPRACDAGLTLIVEDSERRAVHGSGQIRVLEDDVRSLATELELHLLQVTGGSGHDALAHCG